jgi:carbamoyl-phosphate synthase large subunit
LENKIKKVLILGSGALKIGEAGEFDYSGSQAIKALKEEGIETILVNPNIATIQTQEGLANEVYFLPVTPHFVERVIAKERPDGIMLSFGGQTALNCGVTLERSGVLEKYGVRVLGTPVSAIECTEDRELFAKKLSEIEVKVPRSIAVASLDEAKKAGREIGYPIMVRIAYALGGLGSGPCADEAQLVERVSAALSHADQVLVEEFLAGWKEIEYEVVRDSADNCITVCNMENFDPLGIHTGESIVVAPSQTLTNEEYHRLRELAIRTVRHLGIVGECNIQYALNPFTGEYRVIEINARLSRSSALASKATGYPLALVSAKIALGKTLLEIDNSVTKVTKACFEPALDYVIVKIPRWDLKKFRRVSRTIGTGMKSVGEIMAIGRTFEEALQKGVRMLEIGVDGLTDPRHVDFGNLQDEIGIPSDIRAFALYQGLKKGLSIDALYDLTSIDKWFLAKMANIVTIEKDLEGRKISEVDESLLRKAKRFGFSDAQIARVCKSTFEKVRGLRKSMGINPCVKRIDTLAAEYPAKTNYLYMTYAGTEDDVSADGRNTVMVLGSGAYRIGSSVEFDWCCVNMVAALRKIGFRTIMVNCNPETVSTDFDECDRLYFEEITFESILEIYEREKPAGIILAVGGQVANNLAVGLCEAGVNILGTQAVDVDRAEDRHKFSKLLDELGVKQPRWRELSIMDEALGFASSVGYPVLVRPSYVLSGAAMAVAMNDDDLVKFLGKATDISKEHPVVISEFIMNAKEIECDGVASGGKLFAYVISEHVENAGVHSGDATLVVPPQRTYLETIRQVKNIAAKIVSALNINGPFNIQFLAKDNEVSVIECNLRASRSFPFVSKVCGENLIDLAAKVMLGWPVPEPKLKPFNLEYVGVKAPQFSFTRLTGADPTLSVEMASTGEVGCIGDDFEEAFLKSMIAVGFKLPVKSVLLSAGPARDKAYFLPAAKTLNDMGVKIYATTGTAVFLREHGIASIKAGWPSEGGEVAADFRIREREVDLVINVPKNYQREELTNGYIIRRTAADYGVPIITNIQLAKRFVEAISKKSLEDLACRSWREYVNIQT